MVFHTASKREENNFLRRIKGLVLLGEMGESMREIWGEIKQAEGAAEAVIAAAREEAKALLAKAEADAKALLAKGEEQAKDRGEQLVAARRQAADQAAKDQAGRARDEAGRLIATARSKTAEAAELVRERMAQ